MSYQVLLKLVLELPSDPYARRRIAMVSGKDDLTDEEVAYIQLQFMEIIGMNMIQEGGLGKIEMG